MSGMLTKSWLFEVVDKRTNKIVESFTLILPPTAITIKEKQRVSITKTFGAPFIDDYGPDNIEITIKAISGTSHVFPTFQTSGLSGGTFGSASFAGVELPSAMKLAATAAEITSLQGYNHRSAFYTFRDTIIRYKDAENWNNKELRVYDMFDEQAYRCQLLDFTLDRTSDKPFYYPFTISLFVLSKMDAKSFKPSIVNFSENVNAAMGAMNSVLDTISEVFSFVENILNAVTAVTSAMETLKVRLGKFAERTNTLLASPIILAKNVMDAWDSLGRVLDDAKNKQRISEIYHAYGKEWVNSAYRHAMGIYGTSISSGSGAQKSESFPVAQGVTPSADFTQGKADIAVQSFMYSGYKVYVVKGGDTLQSIALSELGDIDFWKAIAQVNNITSNSSLTSGQNIYIPTQTASYNVNKDAYILTEDTVRDPYGADIQLDSNGKMIILESGDFGLIGGVDNIKQAIDVRLRTMAGSLITHTAYGLVSQPGVPGTEMAVKYLRMNIKSTLMQDPRITGVSNLKIGIDSDAIYVAMDIAIVGYDSTIPVTSTIAA